MPNSKMHPDQVETDTGLVRRLLRDQFSRWAHLPIREVDSYGTDHDIYRVGNRLSVRLPKIHWATQQAAKEARWLPLLAPHLPLAVPVPLAMGHPAEEYPFDWSVYEWLPGGSASDGIDDMNRAAEDLAAFIAALRAIDTTGAPSRPIGGRGSPLAEVDKVVQRSIEKLGHRIDRSSALRMWSAAVEAPAWEGPDLWVHGDLLPGNLLLMHDRLSAVIDFGGLNVGDPACDLQPAWNVFTGGSRARFREALGGVDEVLWRRGQGWVIFQTVAALAYYWDTNPGMVRQASKGLAEVLAETPS